MAIINYTNNGLKSKVVLFKECTKHGDRFAVSYRFGDEFDSKTVEKLAVLCDTVAFREHYKYLFGKYPEMLDDIQIFKMPSRVYCVSFMDTDMIPALRTAECISNILKVECDYTFTNIQSILST